MKDWEQAAILTDVLDRHMDRLVSTDGSDWSVFWALDPFLRLIHEEPLLAALAADYRDEADRVRAACLRQLDALGERAAIVLDEHRPGLHVLESSIPSDVRPRLPVDAYFTSSANREQRINAAMGMAAAWDELRRGGLPRTSTDQALVDAVAAVDELADALRALRLTHQRTEVQLAGAAHRRLLDRAYDRDYVPTGSRPDADEHNKKVERLHGYISTAREWGVRSERDQPSVVDVQRDVRTLHLALVTALARGRSRWAIVRRFAARCESFDRERLVGVAHRPPGSRGPKAEAKLTLEFARYLFDAGFNPLVDAAACGLRPDVFDATNEPAVYVEAKQYEKVGDSVVGKLRDAVAQTINTWSRLTKRWSVPEAFLLVFRMSGRPIDIDRPSQVFGNGTLYVIVVDLAESVDSGSRAKPPVRIRLADLVPNAPPT